MTKSVLILTFIALVTGLGAAETLNVDADFGEDDLNANNYASIQAAVDKADSNGESDLITVYDGTYQEDIDIDAPDVKLVSENQYGAVIDPSGTPDRIVDVRGSQTDLENVTIEDFKIIGDQSNSEIGVKAHGTTNITDNKIVDAGTAIQAGSTIGEGLQIRGNVIEEDKAGDNYLVGISVMDNDAEVVENTISGASTEGIGVSGNDHILRNNDVSVDSGSPDVRFYADPISVNGVEGENPDYAYEVIESNPRLSDVAFDYNHQEGQDVVYPGPVENTDSGKTYQTISDALESVEEGQTIEVESGQYDEAVVIDKSEIKLKGPNAGIEGVPKEVSRSSEAKINGGVEISADDVVIDGFKFAVDSANDEDSGVYVTSADTTTVKNNVFEGEGGTEGDSATQGVEFSSYEQNGAFVSSNKFTSLRTGIYSGTDSDVSVDQNTFESNYVGVGGIAKDTNADFDSNSFSQNNYEAVGVGEGESNFEDQNDLVKAQKDGYVAYYDNLQDAVNNAVEGSQVELMEGTYSPVLVDQKVEITSSGERDETVIDAEGSGNVVEITPGIGSVNVTDLTIRNGGSVGVIYMSSGAKTVNHKDVRIENNLIESNDHMGVYLVDTKNAIIKGNEFVSNGQSPPEGKSDYGAVIIPSVESAEIRGNEFDSNSGSDIYVYEYGQVENSEIKAKENSFGEAGIENKDSGLSVAATQNYWGQAEGPSDDQISGDVNVRPWLLNDPADVEVTKYDQTVAFEDGWTAFSFPKNVEDVKVAGDETATILGYSGEWVPTSVEDMNTSSLGAYFGHEDARAIGYNVAGEGSPTRQVVDGWNFVGAFDQPDTEFGSVFSTIRSATDSVSFATENVEALTSEDQIGTGLNYFGAVKDQQTSEYGGYWIKASGERTLETSTPEQPEDPQEVEG